jgi:hypothetical protein
MIEQVMSSGQPSVLNAPSAMKARGAKELLKLVLNIL